MTPARTHAAPRELHLVVFTLDRWEYGIEVADVGGIYHGLAIVPTADEPEFVAGDIRLFHQRVPVIDLRKLLHLEASRSDPGWILITEFRGRTLALLVDRVTEVVRLKPQSLIAIGAQHERVPAHEHLTAAVSCRNRTIYLPDLPGILAQSQV